MRDGQRQGLSPAPSNLTPKTRGAQEGGRQLGQANGAPQSNCGCPTVLGPCLVRKESPKAEGQHGDPTQDTVVLGGSSSPQLGSQGGQFSPLTGTGGCPGNSNQCGPERPRWRGGERGLTQYRDHGAEFTVQRSHSRIRCTVYTELFSDGPQTVLPSEVQAVSPHPCACLALVPCGTPGSSHCFRPCVTPCPAFSPLTSSSPSSWSQPGGSCLLPQIHQVPS